MNYLDSSYLVRLYIRQPGSDAVVAHLAGKGDFVCCLHGRIEVVSALKRQEREGCWRLPTPRRAGNGRGGGGRLQAASAVEPRAPITERVGALRLRLIDQPARANEVRRRSHRWDW